GTRIRARYVKTGRRTLSVRLGAHDENRPVLVDPVIQYGTFLGGNHNDTVSALTVDAAGDAFVAGTTNSSNFPGLGPNSIQSTGPNGPQVPFYGFVSKINPSGTAILYSTLYGGGGGDGVNAIAVDPAGNAYIVGTSQSASLPGIGPGSTQ